MLSEINAIYNLTIWLFHWSNLTELETFYLTQKYFLLWRCEIFCKYCNKFVLCTDKCMPWQIFTLVYFRHDKFPDTSFCVSTKKSHAAHWYLFPSCAECLCVLKITFCYAKKLHWYFFPSCTDCLCILRLPFTAAR